MTTPWHDFAGEIISGKYPLLECLHAGDDSAVFSTMIGEERRSAVVHLYDPDPQNRNSYPPRWAQVRSWSSPYFLEIVDSGETELGEIRPLFAITEAPDDVLASVLAERPLSEAETRQVAESVTGAFEQLHRHGLTHGDLHPASVYAVGDRIKLSPVDVPAEGSSASDDMESLGLLLLTCCTGRVPDRMNLVDSIAATPEPFREIVTRTIETDPQKRWNVARVRAALEGKVPAAPSFPVRKSNVLKYAGATAVVVLLGIILGRWISDSKPPAQVAPSVARYKPSPTSAPPPREAVVRPSTPHPEGARSRLTNQPALTTQMQPGTHMVVVATYNRLDQAEKRARSLTARWPKFPATVVAPRQEHPPYFVTIGANLSKDEAVRLQHRARTAGLPRDTYVTR